MTSRSFELDESTFTQLNEMLSKVELMDRGQFLADSVKEAMQPAVTVARRLIPLRPKYPDVATQRTFEMQ